MRTLRLTVISIALCAAFGAPAAVRATHSEYDLKSQLKLLAQWWPGEYDNHEQIVRQSGGGLSPLTDKPFYRVHSRYELLAKSPLGENVFSLVQYRDNDPSHVVRTAAFSAVVDKAAGALRLTQYVPKAAGSSDMVSLGSGCDVLVHFVGGQFEGSVAPKVCTVGGKNVDFQIVVGSRFAWYREHSDDWFEQTKARPFTCFVQEAADGVMRNTRFLKTIHLHDQGGEADIAWPDGRTLTFTIHTRAFTSPSALEYPLFRIHEKGNPIPIAYAYASGTDTHFGLNLGWFYVRCYADGEDMGADAVYNK